MSGGHVLSAIGGRARIGLATVSMAFTAVLIAAFAGPADAASRTVNAQLSLTGLASADNPVGGSQIGVHPGDKVTFSAAAAPTAGLDQLGLTGLAGSLPVLGSTGLGNTGLGNVGSGSTSGGGGLGGTGLGGSGGLGGTGLGGAFSNLGSSVGANAPSQAAEFQVTADFSGLPGGSKNTVLSGSRTRTFTFAKKGTFSFTWTAQQITAAGVAPINLDGNQLQQAGVKLNAKNQYVGKVVAATNPPTGGLSVQSPNVSVAPSAPVVGQLPTVSIPGLSLPTVSVPVPNLNPGAAAAGIGSGSGSGAGAGSGNAGSAPANSGPTFQPPALSVPQEVVPGLGSANSGGGSGGNGGFHLGVADAGANSGLSVTGDVSGSGSGSGTGSGSASGAKAQAPGGPHTVDLASSASSPSGQLPVLLAILAVITLAVVAGIYARLYLLGRKTTAAS